MALSVCIITLNEEKYIKKCIESIANIADEIIVIDSGSTDKTVEIAKNLGAKIYFRNFDNYASQKNYALERSTKNWVFFIDGDEIIEKELSDEIKEAIKSDVFSGYTIPRKNIIFGKFIKYSRWQPELDRHVWLFKKEKSKWEGLVHEEIKVNGKIGKLKNSKVHFQYETVSEFLEMMDKYSTLEASEKIGVGIGFDWLHLIFSPIYNFLVRYIYRLGFLDGVHGFILSYLMAIYHFEMWVKIWELSKK